MAGVPRLEDVLSAEEFQNRNYTAKMNVLNGYFKEAESRFGYDQESLTTLGIARLNAETIVERDEFSRRVGGSLPEGSSPEQVQAATEAALQRFNSGAPPENAAEALMKAQYDRFRDSVAKTAEYREWAPVTDEGTPAAKGLELFAYRRVPHPSRKDLYEFRFPDGFVDIADQLGEAPTREQIVEFARGHEININRKEDTLFSMRSPEWRAFEEKFGTDDPWYKTIPGGLVEGAATGIADIHRMLTQAAPEALASVMETAANKTGEMTGRDIMGEIGAQFSPKPVHDESGQLVGVDRDAGAVMGDTIEVLGDQVSETMRLSQEDIDAFTGWIDQAMPKGSETKRREAQGETFQMDNPRWYADAGSRVVGQLLLQGASARAGAGAAGLIGDSVKLRRIGQLTGFASAGAGAVAGNVYEEALNDNLAGGLPEDQAAAAAGVESMATGLATWMLEYVSGKVLMNNPTVEASVRGMARKALSSRARTMAGKAGVEGLTEAAQDAAAMVVGAYARPDTLGGQVLSSELEALQSFAFQGDLEALKRSQLAASAVLGGLAGGVVGAGVPILPRLPADPSTPTVDPETGNLDAGPGVVPPPPDGPDIKILQGNDGRFVVRSGFRTGHVEIGRQELPQGALPLEDFYVSNAQEAADVESALRAKLGVGKALAYQETLPEDSPEKLPWEDRRNLRAQLREVDGFLNGIRAGQNFTVTDRSLGAYESKAEALAAADAFNAEMNQLPPEVQMDKAVEKAAKRIFENKMLPRLIRGTWGETTVTRGKGKGKGVEKKTVPARVGISVRVDSEGKIIPGKGVSKKDAQEAVASAKKAALAEAQMAFKGVDFLSPEGNPVPLARVVPVEFTPEVLFSPPAPASRRFDTSAQRQSRPTGLRTSAEVAASVPGTVAQSESTALGSAVTAVNAPQNSIRYEVVVAQPNTTAGQEAGTEAPMAQDEAAAAPTAARDSLGEETAPGTAPEAEAAPEATEGAPEATPPEPVTYAGPTATREEVETLAKSLGLEPGSWLQFVDNAPAAPNGNRWSMKVQGNQVTVNLAAQKNRAQTASDLSHEIAHIAARDTGVRKAAKALSGTLTPDERAAIEEWISAYPEAEQGEEALAEVLRTLVFKGDQKKVGLWQGFLDAVREFLSKIGLAKMPRSLAEEIARDAFRAALADIIPAQTTLPEHMALARDPSPVPQGGRFDGLAAAARRAQGAERTPGRPPVANPVTKNTPTVEKTAEMIRSGQIAGTQKEWDQRVKDAVTRFALDPVGGLISSAFSVISTDLANIHPEIMAISRAYTFWELQKHVEWGAAANPFIKAMAKVRRANPNDARAIDFLLRHGEYDGARKILGDHGFAETIDTIRPMLKQIRSEWVAAGRDIGDLGEDYYFPAKVIPDKLDEFRSERSNGVLRDILEVELDKAAKKNGGTLTKEQEDDVANLLIYRLSRGRSDRVSGHTKQRKLKEVAANLMKYYETPEKTLAGYVRDAAKDIGKRSFLGMDGSQVLDEIGGTIGGVINTLHRNGEIDDKGFSKATELLKALGNHNYMPPGLVNTLIDTGYAVTIANFISALTQLSDFTYAAYLGGAYTLPGMDQLPEIKGVTRDALGLHHSIELAGRGYAGKSLDVLTKVSLFSAMDGFGKNNIMRAWIANARNSPFEKFYKEMAAYEPFLGGQSLQDVYNDMREGKATYNVKFLAFAKLSDFHPVSLVEMPKSYLKHGDHALYRIFYMLKSFSIKALDVYRREGFQRIGQGIQEHDAKKVLAGLRDLVFLAGGLAMAGAGADELKQLIQGRDVKFSDNVISQMWKLILMNQYRAEKIAKGEPRSMIQGASEFVFSPPAVGTAFEVGESFVRASRKAAEDPDVTFGDSLVEEVSKSRILTSLPGVGSILYYRFGAGKGKEKEKALESFKETYSDEIKALRKEQAVLNKIPEGQRTYEQQARRRHLDNLLGGGYRGVTSHYQKVLEEAFNAGDTTTAVDAREQILKLIEDPQAAEYQKRLMGQDLLQPYKRPGYMPAKN